MKWIFEHFPIMEVWVRIIYKWLLGTGVLKKRIVPNEKAREELKTDIALLDNYLDSQGVKRGDILIVHSSMKGIKGFHLGPDEIISYLKDKVGKDGMLLMPTYPDYPKTAHKISFETENLDTLDYDVQKTKGWTGIITERFRESKDVIRSRYPNNTLAAWGNRASEIFQGELESDLSFDRNSAWRYCSDHHAKVLFLGIHAHHSISEIHIAEDMLDKKWPVKGWYDTRKYNIIDGGEIIQKQCRVRKDFWTKYMTEYNCCYRLRKQGVLFEDQINNINVSFIPDLYEFESYVTKCAVKGDLLIFKIPGKYRRKGV